MLFYELCLLAIGAIGGASILWARDTRCLRRKSLAGVSRAFVPVADAGPTFALSDIDAMIAMPTDGHVVVAILAVERIGEARSRHGHEAAAGMMRAIANVALTILPGARIGRIDRGAIEIGFRVDTPDEIDPLLHDLLPGIAGAIRTLDLDVLPEVKIGHAMRTEECHQPARLLARAEQALVRARIARQLVAGFDAADERRAVRRDWMIRDLATAIERDEMFLCYQPKLRAKTGRIDGAEALLRWRHPEHGLVPPDEFIPIAEESGLIRSITQWTIEQALIDQATITAGGGSTIVYVNLSGPLLADRSFGRWVLSICQDAVGRIGLEITETAVINDPVAAIENLRSFSAAGIRIAIDDYGAGLSSLAYLKELPADELKIDKLFLSGLTTSERDSLLVRSTIDLAHALGMEVTAEGVETFGTMALLRVMGCDLIQGYHIARPLELDAFCAFVDDHARGIDGDRANGRAGAQDGGGHRPPISVIA